MPDSIPPNFFLIGAPKCGTTSLCEILARHPDVCFSKVKEPRFFSHDEIHAKGLDWYRDLFPGWMDKRAVGEGSTSYATASREEVATRRIASHVPAARLIYCVRDPFERIESIWMDHQMTRFETGPDFSEGRVGADFSQDVLDNPGFVETSNYWRRIQIWRKAFGDENIHIVILEERQKQPDRVLRELFRFLDIREDAAVEKLDRSSHVTFDRRYPNRLGAALRRVRGWGRLRASLPRGLDGWIENRTTRCFDERPVWTPEVRRNVADHIVSDSVMFLRHFGRRADLWDLSSR